MKIYPTKFNTLTVEGLSDNDAVARQLLDCRKQLYKKGEFFTMNQYGKHYFLFITADNAQRVNICVYFFI